MSLVATDNLLSWFLVLYDMPQMSLEVIVLLLTANTMVGTFLIDAG